MMTLIPDTLDNVTASIQYLLDKSAKDEAVRVLAISIVTNEPSPISAIHTWVRKNVRYTDDPTDMELFTSPAKLVSDFNNKLPIAEDCDGMAILTVALLRSVGIPSNVVLMDTHGNGYDHVVTRAFSPKINEYIMIDPASSFPTGWEEKSYTKLVIN